MSNNNYGIEAIAALPEFTGEAKTGLHELSATTQPRRWMMPPQQL